MLNRKTTKSHSAITKANQPNEEVLPMSKKSLLFNVCREILLTLFTELVSQKAGWQIGLATGVCNPTTKYL
jgi:hypothetical protein